MNTKRDWLGGQYDVHLFVPFFLLVHSVWSKLTVQCAWISKSQCQTQELYSVLPSLDGLDAALTESGCTNSIAQDDIVRSLCEMRSCQRGTQVGRTSRCSNTTVMTL